MKKWNIILFAVVSHLGMADVASSALTDGLVAYYPFLGNAHDESGNDHDGIVHGAVLTKDRFDHTNNAYHFNGTSDYIDLPSLYSNSPTYLTLNAWIKLNALDHRQMITSKSDGGNTSGIFALEIWDNVIAMHLNYGGGMGGWHTTFGNTQLVSNVWYQITATYDGSNMQVFLNGVLDGSTPYSQGMGTNTLPWVIGAHAGWGAPYDGFTFAGAIDDIRLYDRALSNAEIQELYHLGLALQIKAQTQSQIGYWGKAVSFSVTAWGGISPYTYQWIKDGQPISGATGSQLVLSDLKDTDAAGYTVTVTDAANNSVTSDPPATLTVLPDVGIATYAGLTIKGGVGQTYGIQATTDMTASTWIGVANVTLTQPTQRWYDPNSTADQPKRFYRVVEGPITIP